VKLDIDKVVLHAGEQSQLSISITSVDPIAKGDLQPNVGVDGRRKTETRALDGLAFDEGFGHGKFALAWAQQFEGLQFGSLTRWRADRTLIVGKTGSGKTTAERA
jgi:hypothetical protein